MGGLRYNENKIRLDLITPHIDNALGRVLTYGARKYDDRNWEKGLSITETIGSLKRHLNSLERGIDFDEESGLLHSDHILANAAFISHMLKTKPQYDDRESFYLKDIRIGLDIDEVIADFLGSVKKFFGIKDEIKSWTVSYSFKSDFKEYCEKNIDFWKNIKPLCNPDDIDFDVRCYITNRKCDLSISQDWIKSNGFPCAPIYSANKKKSDIINKLNEDEETRLDVFVDDNYRNFLDINNNTKTACFLFDSEHNRRFDVGYRRIKSIREITEKFK